jgi:hypothetical protein
MFLLGIFLSCGISLFDPKILGKKIFKNTNHYGLWVKIYSFALQIIPINKTSQLKSNQLLYFGLIECLDNASIS